MKRIDLNDRLIDTLLTQIRYAFGTEEIETFDMYGEAVYIGEGPVTLSIYYELVDRSRKTLQKALKLGDVIEQYVAPVLNMPVGEKMNVRIKHAGEHIIVEIPHPEPWRPTIQELEERAEELFWLGFNQKNTLTTIDLLNLQTGLMVVGTSGSGKTNAMAWLTLQALEAGWLLALIDLKGGKDWHHWAPWATWGPAYIEDDADQVLDALTAEMKRRNSPDGYRTPPILFIFDELPAASNTLQEKLAEVSAQGRSAGMRTLTGTQSAGEDIVHKIRKNLRSRLVGLVAGKSEANNATNKAGSGAELLQGRGDMLLTIDNGPLQRLQVPQAINDDGPLPPTWRRLTALEQPQKRSVKRKVWEEQSTNKKLLRVSQDKSMPARRGLFEEAYTQLKKAAENGGRGRTPPPRWMIARSIAHIDRGYGVPAFAKLLRWHVTRTGNQISQRRRRECRNVASNLVERRN